MTIIPDSIDHLISLLNENNPIITRILIPENQFKDISSTQEKAICKGLENNTTLCRLIVSENRLDGKFLNDIKEALTKNNTLVEFVYDKYDHNQQTIDSIQEKISSNREHVIHETFTPQSTKCVSNTNSEVALTLYAREIILDKGDANLLYALILQHPCLLTMPDPLFKGLLLNAVDSGNIDCAKVILQLGAQFKVEVYDLHKSLINAVRSNDIVLTALLLKNGSNVHIQTDGFTLLHDAQSVEIASLLIDYGADLFHTVKPEESTEVIYHGNTVLHSIFRHMPNPDLVQYLLNRGIPVNAQNNDGNTALHMLSRTRKFTNESLYQILLDQNINLLLKAGANPLIKDNTEATPLDLARRFENNVSLWASIVRDYVKTRDRINFINKGIQYQNINNKIQSQGFFGAPRDILQKIAFMVISADSLDKDTGEALARHMFKG
ncbi:MAG TPA: ankyrin repeat domain-containing protein [Legionella sp.]|nr:ankyrin repeat domain-containing protein [Legionella sp.]